MGRLMACNDETDGRRDKRDMHVRGHYSSAAHTLTHTNTANTTQGCRKNCLPPTSFYFSHLFPFFFFFYIFLSPSCSSHPPSVPSDSYFSLVHWRLISFISMYIIHHKTDAIFKEHNFSSNGLNTLMTSNP